MGYRLGHKFDAEYSEQTQDILANDTILLYTDGIIEQQNPKEKMYGGRRLLKAFIANVNDRGDDMIKNIVGDADQFARSVKRDDDLTMVVIKMNNQQSEALNKAS